MHYQRAIMWEKAMRLAEAALRCARCLPREERFGMATQMSRAAVSVPSNIAEGWNRESRREKAQFLAIAHGSLGELNSLLILGGRLGWLSPTDLSPALALVDEIGRMLTTLRQRLRTPPKPTTNS